MKTILGSLVVLVLSAFSTVAGEPQVWTVSSRADIMRGEARSVSITAAGAISPAPRVSELYRTEQPYIFSAALDSAGRVYLGTGSDGRIYRYNAGGGGSLFADLNELNVSAIAIGRGDSVFAATSPDGKVYRIDQNGTPTVYFEPGEKYIWSLAVLPDGSLAVGTGDSGKIYRVRSAGQAPSAALLFDTSETHIISLAADPAGNLYAGTDSSGLVLSFGPDGKPFGLLDSTLREIHEIAIGPDGSIYALALGESASATKPEPSPSPSPVSPAPANAIQTPQPQKSRSDLTGAKSAVYRIHRNGGSDVIWSSTTVAGFSLFAQPDGSGVMVGTSDRGRIYSVGNDGRETLTLQTDASQISTIFGRGNDVFAATSNQGRLLKIGPDLVSEGIYESAVLDAKLSANWGDAWWTSNGNVSIETRSGNSEHANETWSAWQGVSATGGRGRVQSPAARFVQWRARLTGSSSILRELSLAYAPRNVAPEVTSIQVLAANVGLAANPPVQLDPNIEMTGLSPASFGIVIVPQAPRRVFQRGARSFQWTAEDANDDRLTFDIYLKQVSDAEFVLLRSGVTDLFYTLDGLSFADGRYVVKVVASDLPGNPTRSSARGELTSEPFDIDNSQPSVTVVGSPRVNGPAAQVEFAVSDKGSYISRAEYSVNGGEWRSVFPVDGISDGPAERYIVDVAGLAAGETHVTLRVFDANGNVGNARAVIRR